MIPYNPFSLPIANNEEDLPTTRQAAPQQEAPYFSTLYFGYASNLSYQTMKQRCPDSLFTGLARLDDWKWTINSTRYANVVPSPGDVVYGSLSFLSNRDEAALDESEGVPWLYEKQKLKVTRLETDGSEMDGPQVEALVYADAQRSVTDTGTIEPDYIVWINKAIRDGIKYGMPSEYVEKYLRPYTPAPTEEQDIIMIRTTRQRGQLTSRAPQAPDHD